MKTFLTTAALVAALAMPAYAQQGSATNAPAGISGVGEANQKKGGAMNAPMKSGSTPTDDKKGAATNEQAGDTSAGEANQKTTGGAMKSGTTGASSMKSPSDKMAPATNAPAGISGAGEANQKK